ncbi:hypothetical protein VN12_19500 [Pirellula sp. SH-Sr6A]|nr:hypothetical protein VN12_19500 [Pirellula sp. SH-Sr6A]
MKPLDRFLFGFALLLIGCAVAIVAVAIEQMKR